ncbi:MAG: pyridoxamine 5'-phosphate oxidase [Rickettsiales bacterium]|nr:pyridoxamine 5'-phosphate oxidase [Rickettsiales bacterium]
MELDVTQSKPFELFDQWFDEASTLDIKEPNAMVLSTVSSEGKPSSRVVLLKHHDTKGFCFYTNLTSHKGKELDANPYVALNFFWEPIGKQIRIEGKAEPVTAKEADDYFASRKRGSQIGAWASMQSSHLESRSVFEERIEQYETQYAG